MGSEMESNDCGIFHKSTFMGPFYPFGRVFSHMFNRINVCFLSFLSKRKFERCEQSTVFVLVFKNGKKYYCDLFLSIKTCYIFVTKHSV